MQLFNLKVYHHFCFPTFKAPLSYFIEDLSSQIIRNFLQVGVGGDGDSFLETNSYLNAMAVQS